MVTSPTAQDPAVQVDIEGDASGFSNAADTVIGRLGDMRGAVGATGAVIAGLSTRLASDAVESAASFSDSVKELQKVAGEDTAQGLRDDIERIAEQTPQTAEEIAGLNCRRGPLVKLRRQPHGATAPPGVVGRCSPVGAHSSPPSALASVAVPAR